MQDEVTIDDIEQDALTPDQIAARCTEYEFAGQKLNPFTRGRQIAATSMGVKIFIGVRTDENGLYPDLLTDAIKMAWLCSVDNKVVRKACTSPDKAIDMALDWWEENGGNLGSKKHDELMDIFTNIMTDLRTVAAETDSTGQSSSSDDLGES